MRLTASHSRSRRISLACQAAWICRPKVHISNSALRRLAALLLDEVLFVAAQEFADGVDAIALAGPAAVLPPGEASARVGEMALGELDDVEAVDDYGRVRRGAVDGGAEGGAHADDDVVHLCPPGSGPGAEPVGGRGRVAALDLFRTDLARRSRRRSRCARHPRRVPTSRWPGSASLPLPPAGSRRFLSPRSRVASRAGPPRRSPRGIAARWASSRTGLGRPAPRCESRRRPRPPTPGAGRWWCASLRALRVSPR